jgi:hypothetical protein
VAIARVQRCFGRRVTNRPAQTSALVSHLEPAPDRHQSIILFSFSESRPKARD